MTEPRGGSRSDDRSPAAPPDEDVRRTSAWWRRVPQVITAPHGVFVALRDPDDDDLDARGEPITAIVILAGMAAVFLSSAWGQLLDDSAIDGYLVVAVLTFIAGCFYGAVGLFLLGLAVWAGARGAGADPPFRLARHLVGFAALPLALSLFVTVPLALLWFGADWFHDGGPDDGAAGWVVRGIGIAAVVWCAGLLVLGLRTTLRLSWVGVATAVGLATVIVAGLAIVPGVLG